jgi:hypothetical protein
MNRRMRKISPCLMHLAPMGIRIEAILTHHDLTFIRNMGSDPYDEF